MAQRMAGEDPFGFAHVLDLHRELDLMVVHPNARGNGIGTQLIAEMANRLRAQGVRIWFGNVTPNLEVEALARFYAANGFRVGERGASLPPLLGKEWLMPGVDQPAFYFWRRL
jgi:GNAT superfamily N-acetyltransferase